MSTWYQKNREKLLAKWRADRAADPEKFRAYKRRWRAEHPEASRRHCATWAKKNPEKVTARVRRWQLANPERYAAQNSAAKKRARARKRDTGQSMLPIIPNAPATK